jgi:predicted RNase H-like HicB family nuclease
MDPAWTPVIQKDGDWWIAWVEELPGANSQGATIEEARENLEEAVALILDANREIRERY